MLLELKSEEIHDAAPPSNPINLRTVVYLNSGAGKTALLLEGLGKDGNVAGQLVSKYYFANDFFTGDRSILKNLIAWIRSEPAMKMKGDAVCNQYKMSGNFL